VTYRAWNKGLKGVSGRPRVPSEDRFWARVKKTKSCWLFNGHRQAKMGYVQFWTPEHGHIYAHRYSWLFHHGKIPENKLILHSCDVTNCIRPDHLWIGTQLDNMRDMIVKGRKVVRYGQANGMWGKKSKGFTGRKHTTAARRLMSRALKGNTRYADHHKNQRPS